jgi:hypothetical protein
VNIRSIFKVTPSEMGGLAWRYGIWISMFILFAIQVWVYLTCPLNDVYDPNYGSIFLIGILLGHFVTAYKWRRGVTVALYILVFSWIVFVFIYVFYLTHVLYPSSPSILSRFSR